MTAHSHELPRPLAMIVGGVAKLLSFDAATFESTVTLHSMRELHRLGATWELLVDPASLVFWIGGIAYLALRSGHRRDAGETVWTFAWKTIRPFAIFSAVVAVWLPVRVGLLMAAYMHLGFRLEFEDQPDAMILFWQPWLHGALLVIPALLAWRFLCTAGPATSATTLLAKPAPPVARRSAAMALAAFAGLAAGFGLWWDPVGESKEGRVLFDEFHIGHNPRTGKTIHWEPTTRPYDTEWYGQDAAYNYACIYDYLTHYYNVRRLEPKNRLESLAAEKPAEDSILIDRIDSAALRDCDVLVLKTPTADFAAEEVDTIKRFVNRGGGLLLIGEHTDVFGTGRHLNTVAREFGFEFRYDCLFGIDHELPKRTRFSAAAALRDGEADGEEDSPPRTVFDQLYRKPWVPHPVAQYMPPLDFATSASIDPGSSNGRAVIRSTGLWSLPADYHADNYYPQVDWRPDMRYGAFVQLWSARYGDGRVLAFADSTILSNFSAFQPGKAELMLGMVDWLNRRDSWGNPRPWLFVLSGAAAVAALYLAWGWHGAKLVLAGVAAGAILIAAPLVRAVHRNGMPQPAADESTITRIIFDRTVSGAKLPAGSFIDGRENGFGIFERWMLRLGYFAFRGADDEAFDGDLLVIVNPAKSPSPRFQEQLLDYVEQGGKLLVLDSTANESSTANELLAPFEIEFDSEKPLEGTLENDHGWEAVPDKRVKQVRGGTAIFRLGGTPVGSFVDYGGGKVVALGFSDRFSDANMGITGDTVPDDDLRKIYDVQYGLIPWIVEN